MNKNIICPYEQNDDCFARDRFCKYDCTLLRSPCLTWTGKLREECPFYKTKEEVKKYHKCKKNTEM